MYLTNKHRACRQANEHDEEAVDYCKVYIVYTNRQKYALVAVSTKLLIFKGWGGGRWLDTILFLV